MYELEDKFLSRHQELDKDLIDKQAKDIKESGEVMSNTLGEVALASPKQTKPFHDVAQQKLLEEAIRYRRQIGSLAEQLALIDNSAEVQPGHVERATKAWADQAEERSAIRTVVKSLSQIMGSVLMGVSVTGIVLNTTQTIADGMGFILAGAFGIAVTCIGEIIRS